MANRRPDNAPVQLPRRLSDYSAPQQRLLLALINARRAADAQADRREREAA
jgi:hypothetical protein